MKKYLLTALTLMTICLTCAALISGFNLLTEPIIEKNNDKKEADLYKQIFVDFKDAKETITEGFSNDFLTKLVIAQDENDNQLGYIYTASGKNSYGVITLLIGINETDTLSGVRFLENGQSFSSETAAHLNGNYTSGIDLEDVENVDTTCGATFAAKLIKELVTAAFADYNAREVA